MNRRRFLGLAAGAGALAAWTLRGARGWARTEFSGTPVPGRTAPGGATAPAKPGAPTPSTSAACREGLEVARAHILSYCATLAFPNGAIHAVRALGRDCPLGPGDPYRLLLENYLVENFVGGRMCLEVPVQHEGHRNAMLKTLLEKGCELDLEFTLQGRPHRFRDYLESTRMLTSYPGNLDIDEHSWTLMALTLTTPPAQARWTNLHGATVDLQRIIDDTSAALWKDTELVRTVDLEAADPQRHCGAFARACGGMHMLYALAVAYGAGYETPARRESFAGHVRTVLRRLAYDENVTASVQRENERVAGKEAASVVAFDARVKFLGHFMETVAVIDRHRLYAFSAGERRQIAAAREHLCRELAESRGMKMERYKSDVWRYDSLTTNVCHAYNGLVLAG